MIAWIMTGLLTYAAVLLLVLGTWAVYVIIRDEIKSH